MLQQPELRQSSKIKNKGAGSCFPPNGSQSEAKGKRANTQGEIERRAENVGDPGPCSSWGPFVSLSFLQFDCTTFLGFPEMILSFFLLS